MTDPAVRYPASHATDLRKTFARLTPIKDLYETKCNAVFEHV